MPVRGEDVGVDALHGVLGALGVHLVVHGDLVVESLVLDEDLDDLGADEVGGDVGVSLDDEGRGDAVDEVEQSLSAAVPVVELVTRVGGEDDGDGIAVVEGSVGEPHVCTGILVVIGGEDSSVRGVGDGHAVGDPRPLGLELDHQIVGCRSLHAFRTGSGYLDGLGHVAGDQELADVRETRLPIGADPQRDDRTRRIDFGGIGTVHELETAVLRIGDLPSSERVSGTGRTVERDDHLVGGVIVAGGEDEEGGGGIDQGEVVDRLSLFDDGGIHQDADGYMGYLGVEDHHIVSVLLVVVAADGLQTLHLRQIRIGVHGDGLSGGVDDLVGPVDELVTSGTVFVDILQVVLGPLQQGHDPVSHSGDGEGVGGVEPGTELHDLAVQQVPGVVLGLGRVEIYGGVAPHELHLDVPSRPASVQGHILGHDAGGGVPGVLVFGLGVPGEEVVSGPDRALHGSDYSAGHGDVHHGGGTVHVVHGHSVHVAGVQLEVPGDWEREGVGVVVCDVGVPAYEVVVGGRTVGEGDDGAVAVGVLQLGAVVDVEDDTDVGGLGD